ncbi:MAG: ROK family protein [Saprospiraceae bacterium]
MADKQNIILGVDIGGTGIKGGLVDIEQGILVSERYRLPTPQPATPDRMAETFRELLDQIEYTGPVGVGFPAVVRKGTALSAANIDESWVNTSITQTLGDVYGGGGIHALNDADAAGLASAIYGAGRGEPGTVLMITIGTGLGSALIVGGELIPNSELGHLYLRNMKKDAEKYVSNALRKHKEWTWEEFGERFNSYLMHVEMLFSPDLILLGGGGSKGFEEYQHLLQVKCPVKSALLLNAAGTVGAAFYAYRMNERVGNQLPI